MLNFSCIKNVKLCKKIFDHLWYDQVESIFIKGIEAHNFNLLVSV